MNKKYSHAWCTAADLGYGQGLTIMKCFYRSAQTTDHPDSHHMADNNGTGQVKLVSQLRTDKQVA
jgi:hypothetical protein